MTALDLISVGFLTSVYLIGTVMTYALWKKTEVEEEKTKVKAVANTVQSPYSRN